MKNNFFSIQRVKWLDISKALVIYLVLLGHIVQFDGSIFRIIFSFHMPAFIIFSGYTLKVENVSFKDFFIKKFKALMIPFFYFAILGMVLSELFPCTHMSRIPINSLPFKNLLNGWPVYGHVGAIWFLNALFWGSLISFIFIKIYELNKPIGALLFCCLFVTASYIRKIMSFIGIPVFPFRWDSSMMFAVFLLIGYFLRKSEILQAKISTGACISVIFICSTLCLLCGYIKNGYVNICDCIYSNCIDYIIAAISGTLAIIYIAKLIELMPHISSFLSDIGKHTLFIFALQAYAYQHLNYLVNKFCHTDFVVQYVPTKYLLYSIALALFSTLLLYAIKKMLNLLLAKAKFFLYNGKK